MLNVEIYNNVCNFFSNFWQGYDCFRRGLTRSRFDTEEVKLMPERHFSNTPPKMGSFKPNLCSTPASSSRGVPEMTVDEAKRVCDKLAQVNETNLKRYNYLLMARGNGIVKHKFFFANQDYKDFLQDATKKFKSLTAERKCVSEDLENSKAERAALRKKIEEVDKVIEDAESRLREKDKEIAAANAAYVSELGEVEIPEDDSDEESIVVENPQVLRRVKEKLMEALSLLNDDSKSLQRIY